VPRAALGCYNDVMSEEGATRDNVEFVAHLYARRAKKRTFVY